MQLLARRRSPPVMLGNYWGSRLAPSHGQWRRTALGSFGWGKPPSPTLWLQAFNSSAAPRTAIAIHNNSPRPHNDLRLDSRCLAMIPTSNRTRPLLIPPAAHTLQRDGYGETLSDLRTLRLSSQLPSPPCGGTEERGWLLSPMPCLSQRPVFGDAPPGCDASGEIKKHGIGIRHATSAAFLTLSSSLSSHTVRKQTHRAAGSKCLRAQPSLADRSLLPSGVQVLNPWPAVPGLILSSQVGLRHKQRLLKDESQKRA